jgi:lactate permease
MIASNLIFWLLAFTPVIFLILLMTIAKMGGSKAGLVTWFVTQLIALIFFSATLEILVIALLKAIFLALDVTMIIWGAMYLYQITKTSGTIQRIGEFLSAFTNNKANLGIFLAWLFPSFLQGIGGFGVPVAVSAPLMVSAGFSPMLSIVLTSIGHGWGVSFGSMGTSIRTLQAMTGLPLELFAAETSILLGITAIISGLLVVFLAGGNKEFFQTLPLTLFIGIVLSIGQYLIARTDFWMIAVTLPAMIGLFLGFILVGNFSKQSRAWVKKLTKEDWNKIIVAFMPYTFLVALIIIFNFFQPLLDLFQAFNFSIQLPGIQTKSGFSIPPELTKSINIFLHPGTVLILTGIISFYFLYRKGYLFKSQHNQCVKSTIKSSNNATIAIFTLVGTAVTMRHAGMISILAEGVSIFFPRELFPIISPFIGALGAFITGSNNNSNVLFAGLQLQTAQMLKLPIAWILAAQTTGGALGSIMAPAKVILGCTTVGLDGKEGQVISRLLFTCTAIILFIGLIVFVVTK